MPKQPADKLEIHDDIVGTGATVKPNDTVTVHYVGVGQTDGKQFDASWTAASRRSSRSTA